MRLETLSDWEVLSRGRTDRRAFAILFERHRDYVYRLTTAFLCDADLAEDVTQEVFLRVLKARKAWVPRARFRTWLYRVALNTAHEFARKRRRDRRLSEKLQAEPMRATDSDDARQLPIQELSEALGLLPGKQRAVVLLRFYEGLSVKETARILGCRDGTVKSNLHKAVTNLRRLMLPSTARVRRGSK